MYAYCRLMPFTVGVSLPKVQPGVKIQFHRRNPSICLLSMAMQKNMLYTFALLPRREFTPTQKECSLLDVLTNSRQQSVHLPHRYCYPITNERNLNSFSQSYPFIFFLHIEAMFVVLHRRTSLQHLIMVTTASLLYIPLLRKSLLQTCFLCTVKQQYYR